MFTDSPAFNDNGFIAETSGRRGKGDIHFGINVSRVFNFKNPVQGSKMNYWSSRMFIVYDSEVSKNSNIHDFFNRPDKNLNSDSLTKLD